MMPCDQCATAQHLGYDACPACFPATPITVAATPQGLLLDVAEQMAHYLATGGTIPASAVAVWLALVTRTRALLPPTTVADTSAGPGAPGEPCGEA
jgi:hypothetical protein